LKTYGSYRRASYDSSNLFMPNIFGGSRAFRVLFNHIKGRNIPMTAPVE
jgi:SOUL heme-binding protein